MVISAMQPGQAIVGALPPIVVDLWWGREKTPTLSPGAPGRQGRSSG